MKKPAAQHAIMRTLPVFYADRDHAAGRAHAALLKRMQSDPSVELWLALSAKPAAPFEFIYLCIANRIRVRVRFDRFEPGKALRCFDGSTRHPKSVAVCTGPVSYPPRDIIRRGFQGHRYTEALW